MKRDIHRNQGGGTMDDWRLTCKPLTDGDEHLTHILVVLIWHFGGVGLLVLGILDSSFLFAPLGNDLLVVAMSAREHSVTRMLYYAPCPRSVRCWDACWWMSFAGRRERAWRSTSRRRIE